MVASGNMTMLLLVAFLLEMIGGAAIFGAASGSGRQPGEKCFFLFRGGGSGSWYTQSTPQGFQPGYGRYFLLLGGGGDYHTQQQPWTQSTSKLVGM